MADEVYSAMNSYVKVLFDAGGIHIMLLSKKGKSSASFYIKC